jgi:methylglutamate dehydrogenase subunit D
VLERRSALAGVLNHDGRDGADGQRRLRIGEVRGWNLLQIAAFAATIADLERAVRPLFGADLPVRVGDAAIAGVRCLMKTGPEQFWIITRDGEDMVPALQAAVAPAIGAITPLSHSRTCIFVEGPPTRELLSKGIAVDFHPDVFRQNFFALTGLHHTPVLVHRSGENRFELYAMRTFALWTWEWLIDAALPVGYDIVKAH